MKKLAFYSMLFIFGNILLFSCDSQNDDNTSEFTIDLSNLKLKLNPNFGLGKENLINYVNLSDFINKNYNEITNMDSDLLLLFHSKNNQLFYSLETLKTLNQTNRLILIH